MAETLDFAARGLVKADVELQPLSAINEVFTRLEHGDVAARVVLDFSSDHAAADRRSDEDEACEDTGND
jgi:propanol-preferring alcohol dehydrogenase